MHFAVSGTRVLHLHGHKEVVIQSALQSSNYITLSNAVADCTDNMLGPNCISVLVFKYCS
jgi:hypothetical protein